MLDVQNFFIFSLLSLMTFFFGFGSYFLLTESTHRLLLQKPCPPALLACSACGLLKFQKTASVSELFRASQLIYCTAGAASMCRSASLIRAWGICQQFNANRAPQSRLLYFAARGLQPVESIDRCAALFAAAIPDALCCLVHSRILEGQLGVWEARPG